MSQPSKASAYAQAGVDLERGDRTLTLIAEAVAATYTPRVLAGLGAFGGLFDVAFLKAYRHPVLAASTDGVGTKTLLAAQLGRVESLGYDIVHHGVNDILAQGAEPLFFLDYLAAQRLEPELAAAVITGVATACREAGLVLLGGETAEMPGVYQAGALDLVGTVVGVCEMDELVTGSSVTAGDRVYALMSGGLQTNGYSLARRLLGGSYDEPFEGGTVGDALLLPHRSYLASVRAVRAALPVKGMAHITGGGLPGNLPRILPRGLGVELRLGSWPIPPIFELLRERGGLEQGELYRTFNMGAGFVLVVAPEDAEALEAHCPEPVYPIGEICEGEGVSLV